jgi:DNA-binding winged helix-turn-helix (wHTH) protein
LQVLVEHAGRVVRKEQLIARVWPDGGRRDQPAGAHRRVAPGAG